MGPKAQSSSFLIITSFMVMILFDVLLSSVLLKENSDLAELNNKIYFHPFSISNAVLESNADIIAMHRYMKDVVLASNQRELETAISLVNKHERNVYQHFKLIRERFLGDKQTVEAAYLAFVKWKPIRDEVIRLQRSNRHREAAAITVGKGAEHVHDLTQKMNLLIGFARSKAFEFKNNSQQAYEDSRNTLYVLQVFIIIFSLAIAFFVTRRIRRSENARQATEERFEDLFRNSEVSIWSEDFSVVLAELNNLRRRGTTDLRGFLEQDSSLARSLAAKVKINDVNNATIKLLEAKGREELLTEIDKTFGSGAMAVFIEELMAFWNKQASFHSEANFITLAGKEISTIVSFKIPTHESDFRNIPVSIVDITARKRAEKQLRLSARVFSDTHEGIVITDTEGMVIDVNPAFSDITGFSRDEIIGQPPTVLSSGRHEPEFYAAMWQDINRTGNWQGEIWNRKKNGEIYAELLTISALLDDEEAIVNYIGVFTDITHSKLQQENIKKLAHYDALTGLPNRALLVDRFNQLSQHAKRTETTLAICFIDLDNFKPVNDTFGHEAGDKLLVEVSDRLKAAVRAEDTVARLGGDEFVLLLGEVGTSSRLHQLITRIIQSLSEPYLIAERTIEISASVGVSLYPSDEEELDVLLRNADHAMYQAKQQGKNNYRFFDTSEAKQVSQQHSWLQEIQQALINNEFRLFYQPKVNMMSGDVIGVEALIRWQHPEKGLLQPNEFLPVLEGTELEVQVGNWVIENGLSQLEQLHEIGLTLEVSVNVSGNQFLDPSFLSHLANALELHPTISPHFFQLEVLESSSLGNLEQMNDIIRICRNKLGVGLALDDFGTGYSSLSHLSQLAVDTIKIDQNFVRDVLSNEHSYSIIDGVIGLADAFNRDLIAEGVEETEHGLLLGLMGCQNAQGYAISKPIPAGDLVSWIKGYKPNAAWIESGLDRDISTQELKIKQFELILEYWFKDLLLVMEKGHKFAPRMVGSESSYLGQMISRLRRKQLFNELWLDELEFVYIELYISLEKLIEMSQFKIKPTKGELNKVYATLNNLQQVLYQFR